MTNRNTDNAMVELTTDEIIAHCVTTNPWQSEVGEYVISGGQQRPPWTLFLMVMSEKEWAFYKWFSFGAEVCCVVLALFQLHAAHAYEHGLYNVSGMYRDAPVLCAVHGWFAMMLFTLGIFVLGCFAYSIKMCISPIAQQYWIISYLGTTLLCVNPPQHTGTLIPARPRCFTPFVIHFLANFPGTPDRLQGHGGLSWVVLPGGQEYCEAWQDSTWLMVDFYGTLQLTALLLYVLLQAQTVKLHCQGTPSP